MVISTKPLRLSIYSTIAQGIASRNITATATPWRALARETQLPPAGNWRLWLFRAGRGSGKTRAGAEWVTGEIVTGQAGRIAVVAPTAADYRDVLVEGKSGLLAVAPNGLKPNFEPSKRRVTYPNGAIVTLYSGEEPKRLRGPEHDLAWADEFCYYQYPQKTYDNLMFGLRIGNNPRCLMTTTPRSIPALKTIRTLPTTVETVDTTYANKHNLSDFFINETISPYEGTHLGRQELMGEMVNEVEGALWTHAMIEQNRVALEDIPEMDMIVVCVDPSIKSASGSDEAGIVTCGIGVDGHGYVLADDTLRGLPHQWGMAANIAYRMWDADVMLGEENQGGDMVRETLTGIVLEVDSVEDAGTSALANIDSDIYYEAVWASSSKMARATPISMLTQQKKIHHAGVFPLLEDEMTSYNGYGQSPNRMDAMVHGLRRLIKNVQIGVR